MPAARPPAVAATPASEPENPAPAPARRRRNRKPIHRITVSSATVAGMAALMGRARPTAEAEADEPAEGDAADGDAPAIPHSAARRPAPHASDARG
jgi:hypothetical protein